MEHFDLLVIGSGPAGQRAAIQGAKSGKKVAVVEQREVVGGACINTGTIPSKTMREAVLHLSGYYYQNVYGVNYRVKEKITMADLSFRVQHVIKTEIDVTQAQLSRNGIELMTGTAKLRRSAHHSRRKLARARRTTRPTSSSSPPAPSRRSRPRSRSTAARSSTATRSCRCRISPRP